MDLACTNVGVATAAAAGSDSVGKMSAATTRGDAGGAPTGHGRLTDPGELLAVVVAQNQAQHRLDALSASRIRSVRRAEMDPQG